MTWNTTLWIGVGLIAVGAVLALREHLWLRNAQVAPGLVTELITFRGSKGRTYKPRVRFTALDGSTHEFVRSYSSSSPGFAVGERVMIAYEARSYEGRILTFSQRYGFAAIIVIMGLTPMIMAVIFITGTKIVPRIYVHNGSKA
jgi:hypothetical protein